MGLLPFLTDTTSVLVFDTSVIINLNASGHATEIITALGCHVAVVDVVSSELGIGNDRGRQDAALLDELVTRGLVEIAMLNESAFSNFESLVSGHAADTLDDGEAATIACAIQRAGIAIIDERKATRISAERFPELRLASTTDLFRHPHVEVAIGRQKLAAGLTKSLQGARMRVFPEHIPWVLDLIGLEQAKSCKSLPMSARSGEEFIVNKVSQ